MKNWAILCVGVWILGCQSSESEKEKGNTYQLNTTIHYAEKFKVDSNQVVVTEPWPGAVKPKKYSVDEVPERIIVTSTTHLPYLELLGIEDRLVGFPNTKYISSQKIRKRMESGQITDLGPDGNLNLELVLSLQPDAVFAFDMGSESTSLDKLAEAGIPVIYNADYLETSALGRAEWIKFFGAFFHKENEADSIFNQIATVYDSLRAMTTKVDQRPTILSGVLYGDIWYLPGGQNWASGFFQDAGGNYLWANDPTSGWLELSFESVFDKARNADFWIGTSTFNTKEELKGQDARYEDFKAFEENEVYNYNKRLNAYGSYDFFESGYARPDLVLADMIKILHPELLPNYTTYYYERLP